MTTALPQEVKYLQQDDEMKIFVNRDIDMSDRTEDLLLSTLDFRKGRVLTHNTLRGRRGAADYIIINNDYH